MYEYEFDVSDTMMSATSSNTLSEKQDSEGTEKEDEESTASKGKTETFKANWKDFKPTYRGRPVPSKEAKELNPAEIKEISIMCRSNVRYHSLFLLYCKGNQLIIGYCLYPFTVRTARRRFQPFHFRHNSIHST